GEGGAGQGEGALQVLPFPFAALLCQLVRFDERFQGCQQCRDGAHPPQDGIRPVRAGEWLPGDPDIDFRSGLPRREIANDLYAFVMNMAVKRPDISLGWFTD